MTGRRSLSILALVLAIVVSARAQNQNQTQAQPNAASAPTPDLATFLTKLPSAKAPVLDRSQATWLATMPLACIDRPQAAPSGRGYVWEATYRPPDDYQKNLAFYGCFDWHSSVNSIWTIVRLVKSYPDLEIAGLIRQRLGKHLDTSNIAGELAYLKTAGQFERPYGYAWILKLSAELAEWKDPEAQTWSAHMAPLATWASAEMAKFFQDLPQPNRGGVHPNSAFAMYLMLDYVEMSKDEALKTVIVDTAKRFYTNDKNCNTKGEPAGSDFLSPCLTEAAVMGRILPRETFLSWLGTFLPAMNSADFKPLTEPVDTTGVSRPEQLAGKSHLIGLAFQRGAMMTRVADLLPSGDPRAAVLRRLAAIHGVKGMQAMYDASYYGSHWLGTYAVLYMLSPQAASQ
jgi:Protein of unknown function (DUF2891)